MLKEVSELRGWIRASCKAEKIRDYHALVLVDKAVRAVREDDAATIEAACKKKTLDDKVCRICAGSAAAIRSRK